jgi:hypothetical protein
VTTIQYSKQTDAFLVVNETRKAIVPSSAFYSRITDCDLIDAAQQARECAGDVVAVSNVSRARGLKPRQSVRHGVIQ